MTASRSRTTRPRPGRSPVRVARVAQRRSRTPVVIGAVVVLALIGLFAIYQANSAPGAPGTDRYQVGSPGIGELAPDFLLPDVTAPAAAGGLPATVQLSDYRGTSVLLYFHEGLGCQPCWDQIQDLVQPGTLASLGADELLSITTGPLDLVAQKMRDEGLTTPALVDTDLRVSSEYETNQYGMMGTSTNGHTFILVGPDGVIGWRADYGGAPRYTMYVPVDQLRADLQAARPAS
jgi:peroxiredoxin